MMGIARSGGRFGACILGVSCPGGHPVAPSAHAHCRGNADRDHYDSLARSLAARRFRSRILTMGQVAKSVQTKVGYIRPRTCRRARTK